MSGTWFMVSATQRAFEAARDQQVNDRPPTRCMHSGCYRRAIRVVGMDEPDHREFSGQTHDCCVVHSRTPEESDQMEDEL